MNYYVLIPDRKQTFQCDSFKEAYKLAYGKQRKYNTTIILESYICVSHKTWRTTRYLFATCFGYNCIVYQVDDEPRTFALREYKECEIYATSN